MPDPAKLPVEIFGPILDLALHGVRKPRLQWHPQLQPNPQSLSDDQPQSDAQSQSQQPPNLLSAPPYQPDSQLLPDPELMLNSQLLCSLALLNRKWYAVSVNIIYREWTYNGAREPFITLWMFLRTVRNNPDIAARMQCLNVGNWGFFPDTRNYGPPREFQIPRGDRQWIHDAIHDAGLGELEDTILQSLSHRDRRPLMAILLASVPNLSTLYAHVPKADPILKKVLQATLSHNNPGTSPSPLRELKELFLLSEFAVFERTRYSYVKAFPRGPFNDEILYIDGSLGLDYIWPLLYLPSLRSLSIDTLDWETADELMNRHAAACHVERLDLIVQFKPILKFLEDWGQGLKSIRLTLSEFRIDISYSEIWNYLRKHQDSLESIDLYQRGDCDGEEIGHFGLLRGFVHLKDLRVHFDMLFGECEHTILSAQATFRLRDTLPRGIQTLELHGHCAYEKHVNIPEQVQELLGGDFPSLKSITFEDFYADFADRKQVAQYREVKEACAEKGILFQIGPGNPLRSIDSWRKTYYMKLDGQERSWLADRSPNALRGELLLC